MLKMLLVFALDMLAIKAGLVVIAIWIMANRAEYTVEILSECSGLSKSAIREKIRDGMKRCMKETVRSDDLTILLYLLVISLLLYNIVRGQKLAMHDVAKSLYIEFTQSNSSTEKSS